VRQLDKITESMRLWSRFVSSTASPKFQTSLLHKVGPNPRCCLVGLGKEAKLTYLPIIREEFDSFSGVEIREIHDKNCVVYPSPKLMLKNERPDLVILSADPVTNTKFLPFFVKERIPVLVEKPILFKPSDFEDFLDDAQRTQAFVYFVENWLCAPQVLEFLDTCIQYLGKCSSDLEISFSFLRKETKPGWRMMSLSGGLLWDYCWHALYITNALCSALSLAVDWNHDINISTETRFSSTGAKASFDCGILRFSFFIQTGTHRRETMMSASNRGREIVLNNDVIRYTGESQSPITKFLQHSPLGDPRSRASWLKRLLNMPLQGPYSLKNNHLRATVCNRLLTSMSANAKKD